MPSLATWTMHGYFPMLLPSISGTFTWPYLAGSIDGSAAF